MLKPYEERLERVNTMGIAWAPESHPQPMVFLGKPIPDSVWTQLIVISVCDRTVSTIHCLQLCGAHVEPLGEHAL